MAEDVRLGDGAVYIRDDHLEKMVGVCWHCGDVMNYWDDVVMETLWRCCNETLWRRCDETLWRCYDEILWKCCDKILWLC